LVLICKQLEKWPCKTVTIISSLIFFAICLFEMALMIIALEVQPESAWEEFRESRLRGSGAAGSRQNT